MIKGVVLGEAIAPDRGPGVGKLGMDVGNAAPLLKVLRGDGVVGAGNMEETVEEEFGAEMVPGPELL